MMKLRSYPKVWNFGHPQVENLFDGEVVVQEKIDGSQFSFGVLDYELYMRSKGAEVFAESTDKLFRPAVDTVMDLYNRDKLQDGWIYRGEVLCKPKHNTLEYDRVPDGNIILFDIDIGLEDRLYPAEAIEEAKELGLEYVPTLYVGELDSVDEIRNFLSMDSCLGGCILEGVVIKNYNQFGRDGKTVMGKHVSEKFKEKHESDWKRRNPNRSDILMDLILRYKNENRWLKSVQHKRDAGELKNSPRDIGPLIKAIQQDIKDEESEEIKEILYNHFIKSIVGGAVKGFPEYYKRILMESQFEDKE